VLISLNVTTFYKGERKWDVQKEQAKNHPNQAPPKKVAVVAVNNPFCLLKKSLLGLF
jgi:hypothetical protein